MMLILDHVELNVGSSSSLQFAPALRNFEASELSLTLKFIFTSSASRTRRVTRATMMVVGQVVMLSRLRTVELLSSSMNTLLTPSRLVSTLLNSVNTLAGTRLLVTTSTL